MIQSGMESGATDSMEKLDELLARLQAEQQATGTTQATSETEGDH
jgi:hypothetical protein